MQFDKHTNLAYSTITGTTSANGLNAGTAGTAITVQSGNGALFGAPQNATVYPAGQYPLNTNAEVVRITNVSGDTLTISRNAETGGVNQNITVGYQIEAGPTAKSLTDIETMVVGGDLVGNIPSPTLSGTSNVESIIRTNSLNQMSAPTGNLNMGSYRNINLAAGIVTTDAAQVGQLAGLQMPYIVSGCTWTADAVGSSLAASMASGTVMIAGVLLTVAAITSHAFTASKDTYIDFADNGDGTASVNYTAVNNNTLSPALANSGTSLNTIRNAIVVSASTITSNNQIFEGNIATTSSGFAGTVGSASNGANITASTLTYATTSGTAPTGGGWATVLNASSALTYTIKFTSATSTLLSGITVIAGAGTVATSDVIMGVTFRSITDMLGNIISPNRPDPGLISVAQYINAYTTTSTLGGAGAPIPGTIAPFIVPPGPPRNVEVAVDIAVLTSSGAAGTRINSNLYIGNQTTLVVSQGAYIPVSGYGGGLMMYSPVKLSPGSYNAQFYASQGAAGTMTLGTLYGYSYVTVKLV